MGADELTALVFRILRVDLLSVGPEFTEDSNMTEAGLDSLALAQLLLEIEQATGRWVDEALLTRENLATARTFARAIHAAYFAAQAAGSP